MDEIDTAPEEKPKEKIEESLTNTVNSKEFQKFLAEKGLTLQPPLRIIETKPKMSTPTIENEVDAKKVRKPSVLQRLFPNGFFSSRRRTTPKDSTPVPIKVHANEPKKEGRLSSARRLVLHRQSMPANCDAYLAKSNLKTSNALGGSSSSISSTLTNVENSEYLESYRANCNKSLKSKSNDSESTRSLSGLRYIDSSSNSTIVTCDKNKNADQHAQNMVKPIPRPRQHINGRSSVPLPQQQTPVTSKSNKETSTSLQKCRILDNRDRDSCVKTRVRTPKIPISNLRPLVNQRNDTKSDQHENEKKVNGFGSDTVKCEQPKRRNQSKLPERLNKVPACAQPNKRILCETSFEVQTHRHDAKTPDSFNDSKAPKSTSTPITDGAPPKFHTEEKKLNYVQNEQILNLSPISMQNESSVEKSAALKMDAATWAKMQELKEKTDRQFYSQPLLIQAHMNAQPIAYSPRIVEQPQQPPPIYDRLPVHNNIVAVQPVYAKVEKKSSLPIGTQFIRNAPYRQSLDQIKMHAIQQQQLSQQQQQPQQQTLNPTIIYQQPVFIRNSPQRNTISGIYRGNPMQRISPQIPQTPITIVQSQQQQQPQRPQSVLDEMMTGRRAQSTPSPSVQLRRNPLSRGEIMSQVIEFCRKSMSKTPTKLFGGASTEQVATVHKDATSSEVSPISYSSMTLSKTSPSIASSRSGKIGPQVPIRKQSLLQHHQQQQQQQQQIKPNTTNHIDQQHPIYERIPKHGTQISTPLINDENKPMNGMISHYAVPPKRYIVVDSEQLTPAHVKQYQQINGSHASLNQPVYIQSNAQKNCNRICHDANAYEYVNVCADNNPSLGNNLLQIYHPNLTPKPVNQVVDRRCTPIILPTIPQHQQINGNASTVEVHLPPGYTKTKVVPKHGRIVMLNNIEQMYRPIAMPAKTIRYQSNQTSQTSLDSRQSADTIDSLQSRKREVIAQSEYNFIMIFECGTIRSSPYIFNCKQKACLLYACECNFFGGSTDWQDSSK